MVVILMMTVGGGDDSDGESSDGADGHKNDRDDDGCLDSVKNFFKNKQINVENFSISTRCRKSLYC